MYTFYLQLRLTQITLQQNILLRTVFRNACEFRKEELWLCIIKFSGLKRPLSLLF